MSLSRSRCVGRNAAQADAWHAGLRPAVGKTEARLFWRYAPEDRNTGARGLASRQSWFRSPSCTENYQFSGLKMRDRCRVPKAACARAPLLVGISVPHGRGPFRFRALLYWARRAGACGFARLPALNRVESSVGAAFEPSPGHARKILTFVCAPHGDLAHVFSELRRRQGAFGLLLWRYSATMAGSAGRDPEGSEVRPESLAQEQHDRVGKDGSRRSETELGRR